MAACLRENPARTLSSSGPEMTAASSAPSRLFIAVRPSRSPADPPVDRRVPAAGVRTANTSATDSASRRRATKPRTWAEAGRATARRPRAQQRPLLGGLRQEAQRRQADQEPVGRRPRSKPNATLSARAEARPASRAGRASARTAGAARRRGAPSPPRRRPRWSPAPDAAGRSDARSSSVLPTPGLSPHDQDGALPASAAFAMSRLRDLQLAGPAEQPGRRMRCHAHHPE